MKSDTIPSPRIPIWLQLSLATMVVLAVSIGILSYVIIERQRTGLYDHIVKLGSVSLRYVADNAKVPLLTDDTLTLSTLINNVASVDGHFYAMIVDTNGVIKAHTDHEKVDTRFEPFKRTGEQVQQGAVSYFNYRLPDGAPVLNLSMPILFQEKQLGEVHVGLSIDFIKQLFVDERTFLVVATLIIIGLGMVAAVLYSLRFTRPLSALVQATSQIARGNYDYKVDSSRNDELGRLGQAFNQMGEELSRQAMIKESFGKYVGSEVLELITRSPGQAWLKGQRSEASILFADIRGFTAYAEGREPEEVVEKLNEFFAIATEVIFKHGGYVDKFIGDSVLAVFGIPVAHLNHQERCIRAAVAMQHQLAKASGAGNPLLSTVGIGIASGIVVAGNIGSSVKMEYTVIGDSVNVASSLNNLAGAGEIIVGSDGGDELSGFAEVESLPPQKIKNREQLVQVFRIVKTICCLLPLLPVLFGCAVPEQDPGTGGESAPALEDSQVLIPVAGQIEAIKNEQAAR
ncbi:MAG: HAMP domain-containing protein, partial [Desulfofustis sp.]|nr:HAMP domain-containing protein [Desulfofustis sp.]